MSQSWDYIAKLVCIGDSGTGKSSLAVRLCEGRFVNWHDVTIGVEYSSTVVPVGPPASLALNVPNPHAKPDSSKAKATSSSSNSKSATPSASKTSSSSAKSHPSSISSPAPSEQTQKRMKLSLWDTAGQETYKSITRSYFRGASGALLVFDITRRSTFDSVTDWLHDLRQIAEEGIVVILVGNKSDLTGASLVEGSTSGASPSTAAAAAAAATPQHDTPAPAPSTRKNKREVTAAEAEAWCTANNVMQYVETSAKSGEGVERAFLQVAERIFQNIEAGKYDLNDRRSGVKGPGAGGGGGTRGRAKGAQGEVVLGVNDVGGMRAGKSAWGNCC